MSLAKHIGTEIVGLQLKDLNDDQKNELAALIAERSVVFFRDQDLSPAQQLELGKHFGQLEIHPAAPQVPGLPGVSVIWDELGTALAGYKKNVCSLARHACLMLIRLVPKHRRYTGMAH